MKCSPSRHARRPGIPFLAAVLMFLLGIGFATAAEQTAHDLVQKAADAYRKGSKEQSLQLVNEAIAKDSKLEEAWLFRAQYYVKEWDSLRAIHDFNEALKINPTNFGLLERRGEEFFKAGKIDNALRDFDEVIRRFPEREPYHWQRGIALYYAGKFAEGKAQFELHRTVNPNDVENAVWHFLCNARLSGLEKARAELMPIRGDTRVPMKEVLLLFAGKATEAEVLKAAGAEGTPSPMRDQQQFYAHLYLGLYYDATGDPVRSREYIKKADENYRSFDYMGAVAHVHAQRAKQ